MYGSNRTIPEQSEHSGLFTEHYFEINNLASIMRLHNAMSGCFLLSDARRRLHLWYQPKERKKLW